MRIFLVLVLLAPLVAAGTIYFLFLTWGDDLPSPQSLRELEPSMNTVVLDRNGQLIDEFFIENRNPVTLNEVPDLMRQAFLATEDRRFYNHWGIDVQGVMRAVVANVTSGSIEQGASTITQQLARKLFLSDSQTMTRKLQEMVLAIRLERSFSKEEILELYLNKIYFGEGAWGIQAAAETFFGKPCQNLELPECALLAGVVANPSAFSPSRHPEAARRRRNVVLRAMQSAGVIDSTSRAAAETTAVALSSAGKSSSLAPYFTELIRQELADRYGTSDVFNGGLTVYTTIDMRLQKAAEEGLEAQIESIETQQAHRYKYLLEEATSKGTLAQPGAAIPYLQGALIAIEPQTGAVRAMVGGRDFNESKFNRATQALRQPGSAFKPLVFTAAFLDGRKPSDIVLDTPFIKEIPGPGNTITEWEPQNFDREFRGPVTIRYALMKSINIPAVRLVEQADPRRVVELAHAMGIDRNLPPYLSLALGTGELTPLEITAAYGVFVNQGIYTEPYLIERVENRYGNQLFEHQTSSREVIDEQTASIMVSMLQSVVDGGTGTSARTRFGLTAPAGGKTGTTDDYSDAWFVGFIPHLSCGVWVGFDEKRSIGPRMTGTAAALPAWATFMKEAVELYGEEEFAVADGLAHAFTCRESGLLALPDCPKVDDLFRPGEMPERVCPLHQSSTFDWPMPERRPRIDSPDQQDRWGLPGQRR